MGITEYTVNTVRALVAAEIAMVNAGYGFVGRGRAERLLNDFFSLVEQAVPSYGDNPLDRRS
jgi:hypothetical protein